MSAFTITVSEPRVPTSIGLKVLNALNVANIVRVVVIVAGLPKEQHDALIKLYSTDASTTTLIAEPNVPASRVKSNVASAAKKLKRDLRSPGTLTLNHEDGSEFTAGHFFYVK